MLFKKDTFSNKKINGMFYICWKMCKLKCNTSICLPGIPHCTLEHIINGVK